MNNANESVVKEPTLETELGHQNDRLQDLIGKIGDINRNLERLSSRIGADGPDLQKKDEDKGQDSRDGTIHVLMNKIDLLDQLLYKNAEIFKKIEQLV